MEAIVTSALAVNDPEMRRLAIWILGMLGNGRHIGLVSGQLADSDEEILACSRRALVLLGSRHMDALLEAFSSQGETIQKELMEVLGEIGDNRAVPLIITVLDTGCGSVREAAANRVWLK